MRDEHRQGAPDVEYVRAEMVGVRRLDSLDLLVRPPAMLKLDVQGFEDRVLRGAEQLLQSVTLIECELSLAHLYEGQPSFREMLDRFADVGFEIFDLEPVFRERRAGRILSVDAWLERVADRARATPDEER
jgi:hypothetical protein